MTQATAVIPHSPTVFTRDGHVFTNSVDVAKYFAKRHPYVTQSVEKLIADGVSYFTETSYLDGKTGKLFKSYDMSRSGFVLLAMGFTGTRALRWKIAYLEAFDAMEEMLRQPQAPAAINMRDPSQWLAVTSQLMEMTKEATVRAEVAEAKVEVITTQLAIAAPKVKFYDKYMDTEGHIILSDAAKALGLGHRKFFRRLVEAKIMFYRDPERKRGLRATKRYEDKGYFVLKGGVAKANNYSFLQTYLTPSGLELLSVFFERVDLFNQLQLAHAD